MKKVDAATISLSIYTPYPGTELYDKTKILGLFPEDFSWNNFSHQSPNNAFIKDICKDKFIKYAKKALQMADLHNKRTKSNIYNLKRKISLAFRQPTLFYKKVKYYLINKKNSLFVL